jgi:hypothetical protein
MKRMNDGVIDGIDHLRSYGAPDPCHVTDKHSQSSLERVQLLFL